MTTIEPTVTYNLTYLCAGVDENPEEIYCDFEITYGIIKFNHQIFPVHIVPWNDFINSKKCDYYTPDEDFGLQKKDGHITFINATSCDMSSQETSCAKFTIPEEFIIPIFKKLIDEPMYQAAVASCAAAVASQNGSSPRSQ